NALLLSPPDLIEYHYGPDSFKKHCELAHEAHARLEICELSSLTLDLDEPEDLTLLENKLNIELN
ncbi:MAG: 2-phospho-L-lactate guanylyltransferase, partial [Chloroflexi bacterium]|nr:2-phospho-L-lactate guanylyltransferase [Chloroflexota bacterium]